MRRTCPYLLGALLIALICLGGGLQQFDQLLGAVAARVAGLLPWQAFMHQPAVATLQLASRELAPIAAALCLMLGPVFHRSSLLTGGLLFVVASGLVLAGTSAVSHAGVVALAPGALLAALLLALLIGTLTRLDPVRTTGQPLCRAVAIRRLSCPLSRNRAPLRF